MEFMDRDILSFLVTTGWFIIGTIWAYKYMEPRRWWNWIGILLLSMGLGALIMYSVFSGFMWDNLPYLFGQFSAVIVYIILGLYLMSKNKKKKSKKR